MHGFGRVLGRPESLQRLHHDGGGDHLRSVLARLGLPQVLSAALGPRSLQHLSERWTILPACWAARSKRRRYPEGAAISRAGAGLRGPRPSIWEHRTSENAVKRKSNFRERFPSNKRSVRMFPATSGKASHVLPTSRRFRFVLISFGSEESRPSRLPHLQPSQYDRAQRYPNRRALGRARHRERTSIRLRRMHELRILDFLRHGLPT
jgi:hypothetical protein